MWSVVFLILIAVTVVFEVGKVLLDKAHDFSNSFDRLSSAQRDQRQD